MRSFIKYSLTAFLLVAIAGTFAYFVRHHDGQLKPTKAGNPISAPSLRGSNGSPVASPSNPLTDLRNQNRGHRYAPVSNPEITIAHMQKTCADAKDWEAAGFATMQEVRTLVQMGTNAIPAMIGALLDRSKDPTFRSLIADALASFNDPVVIDALKRVISDASEPDIIRQQAIVAVTLLGARNAEYEIETVLQSTTNTTLRVVAMNAAGTLRYSSVVPYATAALQDDDPSVRHSAVRALSNLEPSDIPSQDVFRLIAKEHGSRKVAENDSAEVRYQATMASACDALGSLGNQEALQQLEIMATDPQENRGVRKSACRNLGRIGGPSAVETLRGSLRLDDEGLRVYAADALAKLNDKGSIEEMEGAYATCKDEWAKQRISQALERIK